MNITEIKNRMTLTFEQAKYIRDGEKYLGLIMKGDRLTWYYETERLLLGREKIEKRGCSCEHKKLNNMVGSLLSQHKSYIDEVLDGR